MRPSIPGGVYALTPPSEDWRSVARATRIFLDAGIRIIQYRRSKIDMSELEELAYIAAQCEAILMINDRLDLAIELGMGVHLGQSDFPGSRSDLPVHLALGVTCHNSLELAQSAAADGASYVSCGAVYPSSTKPEARSASLAELGVMCRRAAADVVAIGGIELSMLGEVQAAGAHGAAVCAGLYRDCQNMSDAAIAERGTQYAKAWKEQAI